MSAETVKRLEALQHIMQAARSTEHTFPGPFVDGINTGLDIALRHIELELSSARGTVQAAEQAAARAA